MKAGSYVNDLTGSVVLALPPGVTGGGLRPYMVVGGGFIHAEAEDFLEIFQVRRTVPAIKLGVGAIGLAHQQRRRAIRRAARAQPVEANDRRSATSAGGSRTRDSRSACC